MSIPHKHHFIPAFYQKAWTGTDGTLVEYSRPHDIVKCRPKTPAATGWKRDLYAFPELPLEAAQHIEAQFFQYADDAASRALASLLAGNKTPWTIESRSAWSRFITAIHVRHPDAMQELRPAVRTIWDDSAEATQHEYERTKQPDFPSTFDEYWAQRDPLLPIKVHVNMIIKALDNETVGAHINRMYWYVLDISKSHDRLLTSDRPVEMSQLLYPAGVAAIPISPTQLFVAANDMTTHSQAHRRESAGCCPQCQYVGHVTRSQIRLQRQRGSDRFYRTHNVDKFGKASPVSKSGARCLNTSVRGAAFCHSPRRRLRSGATECPSGIWIAF